jgi:hypothetical protein
VNNKRDIVKLDFYQIRNMLNCKMQTEKSLIEWWQLISEKKCDRYTHSQEDEYNEALKAFLQ